MELALVILSLLVVAQAVILLRAGNQIRRNLQQNKPNLPEDFDELRARIADLEAKQKSYYRELHEDMRLRVFTLERNVEKLYEIKEP